MRSDARLLLLDRDAVDALLVPDDVLLSVRGAFELHSRREGPLFSVTREELSTGGIFGIEAGDVQSQGLLGFKAAGFWPSNRQLGGEPHQATVLLFDPATGCPLCVIDGNTPETSCAELGDLLTGSASFARGTADITVFDMTGLALQDMTVARLIFQKASAAGVGVSVPWPW